MVKSSEWWSLEQQPVAYYREAAARARRLYAEATTPRLKPYLVEVIAPAVFALPITIGREPSPSSGAVLDKQPTASTILLSAQEATARLRNIVAGFFFRRLRTEDGKRIRRLLVKSRRGWTRSDKRSKGRPAIGKPRTACRFAQARLGDKADAGSRSRSRLHSPPPATQK
jgi:hypothetical protein